MLLSALRARVGLLWLEDQTGAIDEVLELFAFIELGIRPDSFSKTAFTTARSKLALGRPEAALERIETFLSGTRRDPL